MNNLERHIETLLLSNDCVIVPRLGGFVAHHICARYVDDEGLFLPPLRTLGFNPQLTLNDSLLAQSYADALDISLPEALSRIEADVDEWLRELDDRGALELPSLGRLYKNAEGHLAFAPTEAGILTPTLFALSSFEMPRRQAAAKASLANLSDVSESSEFSEKSELSENSETSEKNQKAPKVITIRLTTIRNTVAAAAVIAATFLLPAPLSRHGEKLASSSNKELVTRVRDTVDSMLTPKATGKNSLHTMPPVRRQPVPTVKAKLRTAATDDAPSAAPAASSESYTIVLCSHVSQTGAAAFAQQAAAAGLKDVKAITGSGANKVVYGHFATQADAQQALRALRDTTSFQQAWIMKEAK